MCLRSNPYASFKQPTAIQQRAIVPFIKGGDMIAQAQSGTGKTGAFVIGLHLTASVKRTAMMLFGQVCYKE